MRSYVVVVASLFVVMLAEFVSGACDDGCFVYKKIYENPGYYRYHEDVCFVGRASTSEGSELCPTQTNRGMQCTTQIQVMRTELESGAGACCETSSVSQAHGADGTGGPSQVQHYKSCNIQGGL